MASDAMLQNKLATKKYTLLKASSVLFIKDKRRQLPDYSLYRTFCLPDQTPGPCIHLSLPLSLFNMLIDTERERRDRERERERERER
jgi:hypothetical protein